MTKIVLDSSIIIEFLRTGQGHLPQLIKQQASHQCSLYLPTIVVAEIWAGKSMASKSTEKKVAKLISLFTLVDLNPEIAVISGKLIREKSVKGYDALIAATALHYSAGLATLNT